MQNKIKLFAIICLFFGCTEYCDEVKFIKLEPMAGVISKKEIHSWNHGAKMIFLSSANGKSNSVYLKYDKSQFWNFVQVGDSIYKKSNSFNITLIKPQAKKSMKFELDLGCK